MDLTHVLEAAGAVPAEADPEHVGAPGSAEVEAYRTLMRSWPSGVTVLGTALEGRLYGCTVSAFTPLGVDPPRILACLDNRSRTRAAVARSRRFSVNILGADQAAVAERFSRNGPVDRFHGVPHRLEHGVPVLEGVVCFLICDVDDLIPAVDHTIVLGSPVMAAVARKAQGPLVHYNRAWRKLLDE